MGDEEVARAMYQALEALIQRRISGFEVRFKPEHRGQRILATALRPFVKNYLSNYTTTLGKHVYFPNRSYIEDYPHTAWRTLAHEYVHLWDGRKKPVRFSLSYVFPQAGAVAAFGALAAFWNPWALISLAALAAAGPWPSRGRTWAEIRGYGMNLAIRYWKSGRRPRIKRYLNTFTGWSYYKMSWSEARIRKAFEDACDRLEETGLPFEEDPEPYQDVRRLMEQHGMLA